MNRYEQTFPRPRQFIRFHPEIARIVGSQNAAILYDRLFFLSNRGIRKDGFIYKTDRELGSETSLSQKQVRTARYKLLQSGWIKAEKKMAGTGGSHASNTWHYLCLVELVDPQPRSNRPKGKFGQPKGKVPRTSQNVSSITEDNHPKDSLNRSVKTGESIKDYFERTGYADKLGLKKPKKGEDGS